MENIEEKYNDLCREIIKLADEIKGKESIGSVKKKITAGRFLKRMTKNYEDISEMVTSAETELQLYDTAISSCESKISNGYDYSGAILKRMNKYQIMRSRCKRDLEKLRENKSEYENLIDRIKKLNNNEE